MSYGQQRLPRSCCCYYYWPRASRYFQLPLVKCEAETLVRSTATRNLLRQTFKNPKDFNIPECTYQFPLYDGVALVDFKCYVDGRVIDGVVKEKQEARQDYEAAKARGEQAALLEQSDSAADVFRTSIGNLSPNCTVVVEITYVSELKHDAETDSLRLEMPTAIAPRYGGHAGFGTATSTVSSYIGYQCREAEIPPEESFTWSCRIYMQDAIMKVESPTHPISLMIGRFDESETEMSLTRARADLQLPSEAGLSKEFVLLIKVKGTDQPVALLEQHEDKENQSAIMATLVPKFNLPPIRPEVVFMVDRSGSMSGFNSGDSPISLAANALKIMLHSLPPGVKFNVCSFGSTHEFLFAKSESYTQTSLYEATQLANRLAADFGGTETFAALKSVVKNRWGDIPLDIMLLTDGDIWHQQQLFEYLNEQVALTKGQIRVFPLGIGSGVSTGLIEGVARAGNGFAQMVQQGESMERRCVRMLKAAMSPHITDYKLTVLYDDGLPDDDDFEIVEPPAYDEVPSSSSLPVRGKQGGKPNNPKPTISLFDQSVDADHNLPTTDTLPEVPRPAFMQAPGRLPALYAFSRTTAYLLLSADALAKRPRAVALRGSCDGADLALEIPLVHVGKGKTLHQLAARKISQDLEEGRAWFHNATVNGQTMRERYPSRLDDIVKREGVRLGTEYQVMNRWCSFVAVDRSQNKEGVYPPEQDQETAVFRSSADTASQTAIQSQFMTAQAHAGAHAQVHRRRGPSIPGSALRLTGSFGAPAPASSAATLAGLGSLAAAPPTPAGRSRINRASFGLFGNSSQSPGSNVSGSALRSAFSPPVFGASHTRSSSGGALFGASTTGDGSTGGGGFGAALFGAAPAAPMASSSPAQQHAAARGRTSSGDAMATAAGFSQSAFAKRWEAGGPKTMPLTCGTELTPIPVSTGRRSSPLSGMTAWGSTPFTARAEKQKKSVPGSADLGRTPRTARAEKERTPVHTMSLDNAAPALEAGEGREALLSLSAATYVPPSSSFHLGAGVPSSPPGADCVMWGEPPANLEKRLREVINLQDFMGFWAARHAAALARLIGQPYAVFEVVPGICNDEWVTAVIIAWLDKAVAAEKETWELVADKAADWLSGNAGEQAAMFVQQAGNRIVIQ